MRVAGWLPLAGLLLAVPVPAARLAAAGYGAATRWPPHQGLRGAAAALKRHSEGTFTSDFTHYLDKLKAKDFVHWLIDTKRYR
ncbi:glucagon-1-like [Rhea pennata]|uniref:glucagon-1-like n=1 Tax=Rhea pennata TaxID=8795 RepID=UPI002E253D5C